MRGGRASSAEPGPSRHQRPPSPDSTQGAGEPGNDRNAHFVVDGDPLWETVGRPERETGLGWLDRAYTRVFVDRLLLRPVPSDLSIALEGGRVPLYIRRVCGDDIYCGAITAVVEESGNAMVWRDFGYQRFPEAERVDRSGMEAVGPFAFDKGAYTRVLEGARRLGDRR